MKPRVRFAPSPTGFLHIGGARTALFNWLFARHTGGTFVLRIEDTDEVRSTQESVQAIFDGMRWMGLDWDEGPTSATDAEAQVGPLGPYYQLNRGAFYQTAVKSLLDKGRAYPCYCTPEEVQVMREKALKVKKDPRYDGTCRHLTSDQIKAKEGEGRKKSIRFRPESHGTIEFDDLIRGHLSFENSVIEDFVILKSSGIPTYNFACVVDDHAMEMTHVIRGDDHLSNTPRQILIYQALGWTHPSFVHLSMILGADGKRLSKRHGATSVGDYAEAGFLPEAVRNYLALLGWSTEDSQQIFGQRELIEKFSLERCGKSPAIFDSEKLTWMNGDYMRRLPVADLVERAAPFLKKAGLLPRNDSQEKELVAVVEMEREKFKVLPDIPQRIDFFFKDVVYDPAAIEKVLKKEGVANLLLGSIDSFKTIDAFTAEATEKACKALAADRGVKNGAVFHPVRVAVSGRTQGPSLFHMLESMGKPKVLERLEKAKAKIHDNSWGEA